jgi:hypothetical protein
VTTNRDQELGNIEKCLGAGYASVVLVGQNDRHIKSLSKFIETELDETEQGKLHYTTPENLPAYLDALGSPAQTTKQTVKGYKVRTVQQVLDPKEASARRQAIAGVIVRSRPPRMRSPLLLRAYP